MWWLIAFRDLLCALPHISARIDLRVGLDAQRSPGIHFAIREHYVGWAHLPATVLGDDGTDVGCGGGVGEDVLTIVALLA